MNAIKYGKPSELNRIREWVEWMVLLVWWWIVETECVCVCVMNAQKVTDEFVPRAQWQLIIIFYFIFLYLRCRWEREQMLSGVTSIGSRLLDDGIRNILQNNLLCCRYVTFYTRNLQLELVWRGWMLLSHIQVVIQVICGCVKCVFGKNIFSFWEFYRRTSTLMANIATCTLLRRRNTRKNEFRIENMCSRFEGFLNDNWTPPLPPTSFTHTEELPMAFMCEHLPHSQSNEFAEWMLFHLDLTMSSCEFAKRFSIFILTQRTHIWQPKRSHSELLCL